MKTIVKMLILMMIVGFASCSKTKAKKTEQDNPFPVKTFSRLICPRDGFVILHVGEESSIKILKGKFKSCLYFVSKDKKALPQQPDVIEKYFETMLYFWEIEM